MEDLLNGQAVTVNFDEQMVFEQLDYNAGLSNVNVNYIGG